MGILAADNLATGYDKRPVSQHLNHIFKEGTITSIIGPNGCGKSTLLKTLARILPVIEGQVILDGKKLADYSSKEIAKELAILSQAPENDIDLTVFDLVSFGRYPYQSGWKNLSAEDQKLIQWALELTDLTALARESIATLSGGQRQRVWIAMALVQDTDIVLLDEPTTYLDPAHQLEILNVLKMINQTQKKTILLTIHDINLASRFSDTIIAMKEGLILKTGTPDEVITKNILQEVFSIDSEIVYHQKEECPLVLSYDIIKKEETT